MRPFTAIALLVLTPAFLASVLAAQQPAAATPPLWAFPVAQPGQPAAPPAPPDDGSPKHVANSTVALTLAQTRNTYDIPDWHPDNHPPAPEIVTKGRRPVIACGYCHLPNGQGRPENASVSGLPASYIIQQMADFKNGLRKSSEPRLGPQNLMVNLAKQTTDAEVKAAADYFASFKLRPWIRVVETAAVPKTRIAGGMFIALENAGVESIGNRIIEVPENLEETELRDSGSGFIAYAPVGSIKKGETLVTTGGGKTTACASCHGADLRGLGPVPTIAGRSPSQMARQMWDIKYGARNGEWTQLMKPVVAKLNEEDLVNITAYLASLKP